MPKKKQLTDDERFEAYMVTVRRHLRKLTDGEITSENDLPDYSYRLNFDAGTSALTTAKYAIAAARSF